MLDMLILQQPSNGIDPGQLRNSFSNIQNFFYSKQN